MLDCTPYPKLNVANVKREGDFLTLNFAQGIQRLIPVDDRSIRVIYTQDSEISEESAHELIGKAMSSEEVDVFFIRDIKNAIYSTASYTGRIFLTPRVVTTWSRVSSQKLADILNQIDSVEKYKDYIYVIPENNGRDNMTVIKMVMK